ncbi:shufflon system plasmid conjugative transfer pilus tip adhesin PilV [Acetobacter suratthaniensis]|uniref:Shufflon system plasmid conjugative transfer pilus tip adhesin PilV n=1 Tax=Acetobacter suratthaniensis TaxID=1502841 RepID=A0ABS3LNY1_9PROT|nr:shufflon system plasmid conjugative transfer pilus tip adhesin PilV [Acetobacter suratthaniensis]MBO1329051.1 shufflon system plasmid conjugative transfer pilus tip adhesin PilV [Acetobacter suratthaniensis]MCX2566928.1 shufflon system plasmid conjugative transfer pilus tip adhesin PilV [Acetobacter suratthaniensis]
MGALFGVIVSLVIGAMAIPVMKQAINANLNAIVLADVASQFQTVLTGGQKYVAANKDTLTDTLRVGGAYQEIPFVALLNTDSLPGGFSQINAVGATWHVYAQQPASGAIRTMVTAMGGRTLSQSDLVKIAGLTGDLGGYVPYDGMLGNLSSSAAHGTTWNLSLAGLPSPGPGHLFGTTTVGDAASPTIDTNDFLYRVGVPGHDNLNTMGVTLNMGGNTITNASTVSAVQGVFANTVTVTSGGCAFNAPGTCLYGDGTNTGVRTKGSVYFQHMDGSAADINANHATTQAVITGTDNGTAILNASCSSNGAIASSTDGTGTHLECISGTWTSLGSDTLSTTVSGAADEYNSWTLIKTRDPTVPTGVRKRLMGQTRHVLPSGNSYDTHITVDFPEPFNAIFPGGYGVSQVTDPIDNGGHDNMPWVAGTPSLNSITVIFNEFTYSNSSGWINWWVEGY